MRWFWFRLELALAIARRLTHDDMRIVIGTASELTTLSQSPRYEGEVAIIALRKGLISLNAIGGLDKYLEPEE